MTKKDFKAIANAIAGSTLTHSPDLVFKPVLIEQLEAYFSTRNPAFDPERFRRACYKAQVREEGTARRD